MDFATKLSGEIADLLLSDLATRGREDLVRAFNPIVEAALKMQRERCARACEEVAAAYRRGAEVSDYPDGFEECLDNAGVARSCAAACRRGA